MVTSPSRRPWSIPGRSRSTAEATSTSSSDRGTPFESWIGQARSAPWPEPANRATRATAATRGVLG